MSTRIHENGVGKAGTFQTLLMAVILVATALIAMLGFSATSAFAAENVTDINVPADEVVLTSSKTGPVSQDVTQADYDKLQNQYNVSPNGPNVITSKTQDVQSVETQTDNGTKTRTKTTTAWTIDGPVGQPANTQNATQENPNGQNSTGNSLNPLLLVPLVAAPVVAAVPVVAALPVVAAVPALAALPLAALPLAAAPVVAVPALAALPLAALPLAAAPVVAAAAIPAITVPAATAGTLAAAVPAVLAAKPLVDAGKLAVAVPAVLAVKPLVDAGKLAVAIPAVLAVKPLVDAGKLAVAVPATVAALLGRKALGDLGALHSLADSTLNIGGPIARTLKGFAFPLIEIAKDHVEDLALAGLGAGLSTILPTTAVVASLVGIPAVLVGTVLAGLGAVLATAGVILPLVAFGTALARGIPVALALGLINAGKLPVVIPLVLGVKLLLDAGKLAVAVPATVAALLGRKALGDLGALHALTDPTLNIGGLIARKLKGQAFPLIEIAKDRVEDLAFAGLIASLFFNPVVQLNVIIIRFFGAFNVINPIHGVSLIDKIYRAIRADFNTPFIVGPLGILVRYFVGEVFPILDNILTSIEVIADFYFTGATLIGTYVLLKILNELVPDFGAIFNGVVVDLINGNWNLIKFVLNAIGHPEWIDDLRHWLWDITGTTTKDEFTKSVTSFILDNPLALMADLVVFVTLKDIVKAKIVLLSNLGVPRFWIDRYIDLAYLGLGFKVLVNTFLLYYLTVHETFKKVIDSVEAIIEAIKNSIANDTDKFKDAVLKVAAAIIPEFDEIEPLVDAIIDAVQDIIKSSDFQFDQIDELIKILTLNESFEGFFGFIENKWNELSDDQKDKVKDLVLNLLGMFIPGFSQIRPTIEIVLDILDKVLDQAEVPVEKAEIGAALTLNRALRVL